VSTLLGAAAWQPELPGKQRRQPRPHSQQLIWPALIWGSGSTYVEIVNRVPTAVGDREESAGSYLEGAYRRMQRGDVSDSAGGSGCAGDQPLGTSSREQFACIGSIWRELLKCAGQRSAVPCYGTAACYCARNALWARATLAEK